MTAKTSRKDVESIVGALTLLFITAVDLVRKGVRDPQMITELRKAFQFFRENVINDDGCAGLCQSGGEGHADAVGAAGYQRGFAGQIK